MRIKRGKTEKTTPSASLNSKTKFSNDKEFQQFQKLYSKLKKKHNLSGNQIINSVEKRDVVVPITIFNKHISGLEAICKYLRENLLLTNKQISVLLNRSEKTIWQAYESSKKKHSKKYPNSPTPFTISLLDFQPRKLSVLETIVKHLKESFGLTYHNIAKLIERDDRTIWTVYQRALKKQNA